MKKNQRQVTIYALVDPRSDVVRYVGASVRPRARYSEHIRTAVQTSNRRHVYCWIRSLISINLKPALFVLEVCRERDWQAREVFWIAKHRADLFSKLTNLTGGGDGFFGYVPSAELRAKWSAMRKGGKFPLERKLKMRGWKHTAESRARISSRGRRPCLESTKEKISAKAKGRDMSDLIKKSADLRRGKQISAEHKAKISASTTNRKPVECLETGVIYPSVTATALAFSAPEAGIYSAIRRNGRCRGKHFRFASPSTISKPQQETTSPKES